MTKRTKQQEQGSSPVSAPLDDSLREYLDALIEPLAKSDEVKLLLARIDEQNAEIGTLRTELAEKDARIVALEDDTKRLSYNQGLMRRKFDDIEQYGRRYSCRINGVPTKKTGETENVSELVEKCYKQMKIPFDANKIDRTHRVGKVMLDRTSKKHVQQVIVKFRSWESRCQFYRARPKRKPAAATSSANVENVPVGEAATEGRVEENAPLRFTIALDLTRDRHKLLRHAQDAVRDNRNVKFAFVDLNCRLTLRMSDESFLHFNTIDEFDNLLSRYAGEPTVNIEGN